jgi:hypothetical protein
MLLLRRQQMMPARDCARAFAKPLGTQHFTTNRTDEFFAGSIA